MARVFISYSHQDEAWKDRVVRQLGVLADEGLETWDDRRIQAGDDWLPEIEEAIAQCDVALLLISAHFLTSNFIKHQEVPALLKRRESEGVRVIPVILSPCQWTRIGWLKSIQARPKDGKRLSGLSEDAAEDALSTLAGEVHDLIQARPVGASLLAKGPASGDETSHREQARLYQTRVDLEHLPAGAPHFLGRGEELAALDGAWAEEGRTAIVQLIAPGGVGKTAVVKRWLQNMQTDGWRGAERVFGWTFYSQGTRSDREVSEDHFLSAALKWFEVPHDPAANPWDKGKWLAEAIRESRTLLVLDGVEPLQYPPGPTAGELRAPGLKTLLQHLSTAGQSGLCLISSRVPLEDLKEFERGESHTGGTVLHRGLDNLSEEDGASLLHTLGAKKAGPAAIGKEDPELREASAEVKGHALTLSLLGRYLALAFDGDIRRRDQVNFQEADAETQDGHAFRVMEAYETWFAREGEKGARYLAAFRLLGFFEHLASRESLRALRAAPAIPNLTRPLVNLKPELWKATLRRLDECGLAYFDADTGSLDAHPLVREYLAEALRTKLPDAWREGHRRIYEQLKASVPHHPEGLAGLQPLYQAVAHGCLAGLQQTVCNEVYWGRVCRGKEAYATKKLGAFGADLVPGHDSSAIF